MAIPARLMMFDGMPKSRIIRKLNRIASGSVSDDDEGAAEVPHDQQDRHACRRSAPPSPCRDRLERLVDQRGAVVERDDPHPLGQPRPGAP